MQQTLLQEALRLAVSVDEMDVDLLQGGGTRDEGDLESVHLMFRINNVVRDTLPRDPAERTRRMSLIMRALCNQIGSEARHLRRLCIALQGLQMMGEERCTGRERSEDDAWLAPLLDEMHLMAASEVTGISVEREWTWELMTLRRWWPKTTWITARERAKGKVSSG